MIVIVDYGTGNLTSIKNMLKKCGADVIISDDVNDISAADKYILPGVGSFDHGISNLRSAKYFTVFQEKVLKKGTPVLGVCLGAQLLAESSEEGSLPGLGWISGKVVRFDQSIVSLEKLKVPHMGWSEVELKKESHIFYDMYLNPRFYFVHSYHWVCSNKEDELMTADYGYTFTAGVEKSNIIGVQFHPEKSHKYGLRLYENFLRFY
jgi:glutamine amidotransferase